MKQIGLTVGFDWKNSPMPLKEYNYKFFHQIQEQNKDIRFYAIDWRSIEENGETTTVDLEDNHVKKINLGNLDLLHNLFLGKCFGEWDWVRRSLDYANQQGVRIINPIETIKYSINKQYLLDLQEKGLPIIPTISVPSSIPLEEMIKIAGDKHGLIKPLNGEAGTLVYKIEDLDEEKLEQYSSSTDRVILQPFMREIYLGERSIIYLGNRLSHSLIKIPPTGGFKANGTVTNATVLPYTPSRDEINLGFEVKDNYKFPLDTFRLDFISTDEGPRIMEVEAVNPCHFVENLGIFKLHAQRIGSFYRTELNK